MEQEGKKSIKEEFQFNIKGYVILGDLCIWKTIDPKCYNVCCLDAMQTQNIWDQIFIL